MKYTRKDVLSRTWDTHTEHDLRIVDHWVASILDTIPYKMSFIVIAFYDLPVYVRSVFNFNGGDEDWFVLSKENNPDNWIPEWISRTDSCQEPDEYDMGSYYVWVGSHA